MAIGYDIASFEDGGLPSTKPPSCPKSDQITRCSHLRFYNGGRPDIPVMIPMTNKWPNTISSVASVICYGKEFCKEILDLICIDTL